MSFPKYPAYKDSGVAWLGEVPAHWETCALKRIADLKSGESITAEDIEEEGDFPVFGGNGLRGFATHYTHDGTFALIGRQGALCGNINYATGKFWASEHAVVATPKVEVETHWLGELMRAMNLNQYSVSAAQPGLSVEIVGNLRIPVPSTHEQTAIARFLDRETAKIDALVAEQEKLITLLKEKRQAVISHAVTKGLDPTVTMKDSGAEWIGPVPSHWNIHRVKDVAKLESGHTPSKQVAEYWENCDIPWVSLNDSKQLAVNDYITDTAVQINRLGLENSSARMLPPGAVVFTRDATIGLAAITTRPMAVSQHLIAWCPTERIEALYLLRVFNATKEHLDSFTFGATIKTIGMGDVKKLATPVPPIDEQRAISEFIAERCGELDSLLSEAQRAITLLEERRTALISAAVTGQIDVRQAAAA